MVLFGCGAKKAPGVQNGRLAPCPSSPNCVSSADKDAPPLPMAPDGPEDSIAKLAAVVESMDRSAVVTRAETYLHATFASPLFRFTDDVEFFADADAGVVHFRSAARSGWYDFGVNGRRMEKIRERYKETLARRD
ncbi:MAG: DUF1499 domain-containing protein [Deltaproteobacteria bacterium]|nr:DUF1499 domain-containing protein [Deltaproteobacteria bacterium]